MGRIGLVAFLLAASLGVAQAATQSVLLLHDAGRKPGPAEHRLISSAVDLLCHFDVDITVAPVQEYRPHALADHSVVVYLGLREGVTLPEAFLTDCYDLDATICWIGANFRQLAARYSLGRYGFEVSTASPDPAPTRVIYNGMPYWRAELPLPRITCTRPDVCTVVATIQGDAEQRPYAVRAGRLWYFPELPLDRARKGGTYLILADQMHEVLTQPHEDRRLALLVVTGISPDTDAGKLSALVRQLQSARTPFGIEVASILSGPVPGEPIRLSRKRGLIGVLRGAQREGASIIAHVPADLEHRPEAIRAAESDPEGGRDSAAPSLPVDLEQVLQEMARCGLYPLAVAAARKAHVQLEGPSLGGAYSTLIERRVAGDDHPLPPPMPFLIENDPSGQRVVPDNLPRLSEGRGQVETLLEAARRQAAVPDPWTTLRVAPGAPPQSITLLITGMRSMGYEFADLRDMTNWTRGASLHIRTFDSEQLLPRVLPDSWDAMVLGPEPGMVHSFGRSDARERQEALVVPGSILVAYPAGSKPKTVFSFEGDPQQITERAVQRIARFVVLFGLAASVVLLLIYTLHLAQRRGARAR